MTTSMLAPDGHPWCFRCGSTGYDATYKGDVQPCEVCNRPVEEPPQGWIYFDDDDRGTMESLVPSGDGHTFIVASPSPLWLPSSPDRWDRSKANGTALWDHHDGKRDRGVTFFGNPTPHDGYYVHCSCGYRPAPIDDERDAWMLAFDHAGIDWRSQPVQPSPRYGADDKKQKKALEGMLANLTADYDGPLVTLFQGCVFDGERDRAFGVKTRHGCRGIIPPSDGSHLVKGAGEICACECHDDPNVDDRPSYCGSSGLSNPCNNLVDEDLPRLETLEGRYGFIHRSCTSCWQRIRRNEVRALEVQDWTRRGYHWPEDDRHNAWHQSDRDPGHWIGKTDDEHRIFYACLDAGYERPKVAEPAAPAKQEALF